MKKTDYKFQTRSSFRGQPHTYAVTITMNVKKYIVGGAIFLMLTSYVYGASGSIPQGKPLDGADLYKNNCEQCHLPLQDSEIKGQRFDRIFSAIRKLGSKASLSSQLTDEQIKAIAKALNKDNNHEKKQGR